jgi:hypothetical protein
MVERLDILEELVIRLDSIKNKIFPIFWRRIQYFGVIDLSA